MVYWGNHVHFCLFILDKHLMAFKNMSISGWDVAFFKILQSSLFVWWITCLLLTSIVSVTFSSCPTFFFSNFVFFLYRYSRIISTICSSGSTTSRMEGSFQCHRIDTHLLYYYRYVFFFLLFSRWPENHKLIVFCQKTISRQLHFPFCTW